MIRRYGSTLFMAVSVLLVTGGLHLGLIELVTTALTVAPIVGAWASWKLWKWHRFYGTRFLWGLFIASVVADVAALPVAILAARRLWLGPDAPRFVGASEAVGLALIVFEGVFVYLVLRWQDLDLDMQRERVGREDETHGTNLPPEEGL